MNIDGEANGTSPLNQLFVNFSVIVVPMILYVVASELCLAEHTSTRKKRCESRIVCIRAETLCLVQLETHACLSYCREQDKDHRISPPLSLPASIISSHDLHRDRTDIPIQRNCCPVSISVLIRSYLTRSAVDPQRSDTVVR